MTGLTILNTPTSVGSNTVFVTGRRSMSAAMTALGVTGGKMSSLKGKSLGATNIPWLAATISLDKPTTLGSNVCRVASSSSVLTITTPSTGYMSNYMNNGIKVTRSTSSVGAGSVAEFKFRSNNFFTSNNGTHMAVILRGVVSTTTLQGKGIIIGNVSGYPSHSGVCKATSLKHDIGAESFWAGGNCVYGSVANPQQLQDGVIYSVKVVANDVKKTISFRIFGENGYDRTQVINDAFYTNSGQTTPTAQDFAIGCVPDKTGRSWYIDFGDIAYYNVK